MTPIQIQTPIKRKHNVRVYSKLTKLNTEILKVTFLARKSFNKILPIKCTRLTDHYQVFILLLLNQMFQKCATQQHLTVINNLKVNYFTMRKNIHKTKDICQTFLK